MKHPDWYYDDLRQVGLDFEDPALVARYDEAQGGTLEAERALADYLIWDQGLAAADIGCGTGLLVAALAERCASVLAVDVSATMLAVVRRRCERAGLTNVELLRGGFLSAALPDASLDLITSQYAFHHLPDFWKAAALARLYAALRPGGRLFLADVVFDCGPEAIPTAVEGWADWMAREAGYSRAEVATHVREEHSTFDWIMRGLIRRSGFQLLAATHDGTVYARYLAKKPEESGVPTS